MKFTLLFYTDGWDLGPVVELPRVPAPGSVVWVSGSRKGSGDESDMYYVDNVMYPEKGMDREEVIYLYVRPYNGYNDYGPKTELDRIAEKLENITGQLKRLKEEVSELNMRTASLGETLAGMASGVEDKHQEISDQLADASFTLAQIKEAME